MNSMAFSPTFIKKLKVITKRDINLQKKIEKQLKLFQINPQHPSLRLHKLSGNLEGVWSLSVTKSFRLIYKDDDRYYFFDLGEHKDIYK